VIFLNNKSYLFRFSVSKRAAEASPAAPRATGCVAPLEVAPSGVGGIRSGKPDA
jgi:hypothetical protein